MREETYIKLQQSEGIVCQMASQLLAAFISSGQLKPENEDHYIDRSLKMAIKLAILADRTIDSDDESIGR